MAQRALTTVPSPVAIGKNGEGPQSALLQHSQLDSLPYLDGEPAPQLLEAAKAAIASAVAALPRDASAYLDVHEPADDTAERAPSQDWSPPKPLPALQAATVDAASAVVTTGSGELAARFSAATWRECCARQEIALEAERRDVAAAQQELARINRRRNAAQRAISERVARMKDEYFAVAADNAELAREIARLRALQADQ